MHGEYLEYEEDVIKMLFNVKKIEDFDLFMILRIWISLSNIIFFVLKISVVHLGSDSFIFGSDHGKKIILCEAW